MQFDSVKSAVQWAEEFASRPDLGSQIGKLLKAKGGEFSREELVDVAHTISLITADCKPYKGMAMKCIYGGYNAHRDYQLGCVIGDHLWNRRRDDPRRKELEQLHRLGRAVIKAERALEVYGDRYPLKRMAYDIGISRQQFTQSLCWPEMLGEARDMLRAWLEQAIKEIGVQLEVRGWLA